MHRLVLVLTLSAVALALASCGSPDENADDANNSPEAYLRAFEEAMDRGGSRLSTAPTAVAGLEPDAGTEELRQAFDRLFAELDDVVTGVRDDLASLNPPDELRDEHDAIVQAFDDVHADVEDTREAIRAAPTRLDVIAAHQQFPDGRSRAANDRLDEACAELQWFADDHKIDVEVDCADDD